MSIELMWNLWLCHRIESLDSTCANFCCDFPTGPTYLNPADEPNVGGIRPSEFTDYFNEKTNYSKTSILSWAALAYDSMYAISIVLNKTLEKMELLGKNVSFIWNDMILFVILYLRIHN